MPKVSHNTESLDKAKDLIFKWTVAQALISGPDIDNKLRWLADNRVTEQTDEEDVHAWVLKIFDYHGLDHQHDTYISVDDYGWDGSEFLDRSREDNTQWCIDKLDAEVLHHRIFE